MNEFTFWLALSAVAAAIPSRNPELDKVCWIVFGGLLVVTVGRWVWVQPAVQRALRVLAVGAIVIAALSALVVWILL